MIIISLCVGQRAVENGAVPVSEPQDKEWGQRVGYVRDIDGIVVRMGSYVVKPAKRDWVKQINAEIVYIVYEECGWISTYAFVYHQVSRLMHK